ncbi:MAG TPA: ATP-binding protein [Candidatus Saccharimonadales bacterium]|nr:ATP-binding protein [Candidatus Saccharimonadales bacterium]
MDPAGKRIKTDRLILLGILALIVILTGAYALLNRAEGLSFQYVTNTVLLGFLGIADVILILALLFIIFRNLVKLFIERRRDNLGARFRTKLVVTFIGLCLVPALLLFIAALSLIQTSIEQWFSTPVESVTQNAQQIVQAFYDEYRDRGRRSAERLAATVTRDDLLASERSGRLVRELGSWLVEHRLDYTAVYRGTRLAASSANPRLPLRDLGSPPETLLRRAVEGEAFDWIEDLGRGRLVRAGWPVRSAVSGKIVGVAVVGSYVRKDLASLTSQVSEAAENYSQIKVQKGAIQRVYVFFFALITLLIIFSAMWIGLYLARQITVPIRMLAEGTRAVAGGDLDYRVETRPGDELGILVESFNAMTAELKARREEAERSAREIRQRHAELEERRRYIETLLQSVPVGVVSLSERGRVTTSNRAARKLLKIEPDTDITGLSYDEVFVNERLSEVGEAARECLESGAGPVLREIRSSVAGEPVNLSLTVTPLGHEPAPGLLIVMEDVTHLIKAQKMAAWQEVARRMAHEIKNPLTPIQLSAQRILKKYSERSGDFGDVLREGTETIVREVKTLKSLVNEFSGFSRMPAVNPVPSDLHEIIDSALGLYQGVYGGVHFQRRFAQDIPTTSLDREQMKRVFINLIDNALEATEQKGEIEIVTRYLRNARLMRIEVADDGPGIRPEAKTRLFLPYFSTKKRGTGLGLAIVARIVSDHNGNIHVEDNMPRGTRFVIELPAAGAWDRPGSGAEGAAA